MIRPVVVVVIIRAQFDQFSVYVFLNVPRECVCEYILICCNIELITFDAVDWGWYWYALCAFDVSNDFIIYYNEAYDSYISEKKNKYMGQNWLIFVRLSHKSIEFSKK